METYLEDNIEDCLAPLKKDVTANHATTTVRRYGRVFYLVIQRYRGFSGLLYEQGGWR